MLAAYLVALIVGGVFVSLSVLSGIDKDGGGGVDKEFAVDKEMAGGDADFDADADADADLGGDADADLDADADADLDADGDLHGGGHLALAHHGGVEHGATLAEASHGGGTRGPEAKRRRRPFLPFLSFRFWTFGSAFFGLTGTVLTTAGLTGEPVTALLAGGVGLGIGTVTSSLVHVLRKPVTSSLTPADYAGLVGELMLPLAAGRMSKIKVRLRNQERELLVVCDVPTALPKGTRVVVTEVDADGRAHVVEESSLYLLEES